MPDPGVGVSPFGPEWYWPSSRAIIVQQDVIRLIRKSMIHPETSTIGPSADTTRSDTAIDTQWGRDKKGRFTKGHRFGFQPGQSGNPAGRPPEVRYVGEYMRDLLPLPVQELPQVAAAPDAPTALCIAARTLLDAVSGENGYVRARAREQVMDRLEGRPVQALQIDCRDEVVVNQIVGPHGPEKILWADKSRLLESKGDDEETPMKLLAQQG